MSLESPIDNTPPESRENSFFGEFRERTEAAFLANDKETITEIHRYNPSYVFLLETSALRDGYKIKEALKAAYPEEPLPKFYRVDPRQVMKVMVIGQKIARGQGTEADKAYFEEKKQELEEFIRRRVLDNNARILVYDEEPHSRLSQASIVGLLKNPADFGLNESLKAPNVKMNHAGEGDDCKITAGPWKYPADNFKEHLTSDAYLDLDVSSSDILPISPISFFTNYKLTSKKKVEPRGFRASIPTHNLKTGSGGDLKEALEVVSMAKEKGVQVGKKLKADLDGGQRKD